MSKLIQWQIEELGPAGSDLRRQLKELWIQDSFSSPFNSPSFVEVVVRKVLSNRERVLFARGLSDDGQTVALWPLKVEHSDRLCFLEHVLGDHCTCLYTPEVALEDLGNGFAWVLDQVKPSSVFLTNIPPWGLTLEAVTRGLDQIGWQRRAFAAISCPVLAVDPGLGVEEGLRKQLRHKTVRNYENRIKRQPGCSFEVFEGPEELEEWTAEFCDVHEWQWNRTPTPSIYRSREARMLFADVLKAWSNDNVLVRFSIRLPAGRVAFVVCLASRGRLIHYHAARSPRFREFRLGHVMIRRIGLWMLDSKRFSVLDFGKGGEEYKFQYANKDEKLWRLWGTASGTSLPFVRGWIEERIRKSDKLQELWDEWANKRIRGKVYQLLRNIRMRILITKRVHYGSPIRNLIGALKYRFISKRDIMYHAHGNSELQDPKVVELKTFDVMNMLEETTGLYASSRASLVEYRYDGARPFGIMKDGQALHVSWLKKASPEEFPEWIRDRAGTVWCIYRSLTAKAARGRGLYPRVLRAILGLVPAEDIVMICTATWNKASQRGIEKAGFLPFAMRLTKRDASTSRFVRLLVH